MKKRMIVVCTTLIWFCFAQGTLGAVEPGIRVVKLGNVVHSLSVEFLSRSPPLIVVKDSFKPEEGPLSQVGLSLTFTDAGVLRALGVNTVSDASFVLSGEIIWCFSSSDCLSMYCTPVVKAIRTGGTEYVLNYLGGLDAFCQRCRTIDRANPVLEMYSKKNTIQTIILPPEFFLLISEVAGSE
jgi:hypothetical protein